MEKDILSMVIDVEREVAERLEKERDRAARWLCGQESELEKQLKEESRKLEEELWLEVAEARERAEAEAARIVGEAGAEARRLAALSDDTLEPMIAPLIEEILPERNRDRQDVQN